MLNKLKALFIIQEEESSNNDPNLDVIDFTKKGVSKSKIHSKNNNNSTNIIMTQLLTILSENNLEGFDYLEYKNAIKSLESMKMDEETRFKSAYATAKTLGITKTKLLESIWFYQKVLNDERIKFVKTLKSKSNTNISNSEEKEILNLIASKNKKIKELTKEITDLEIKIYGSLNGHTGSDFENTTNKLIREMREDIKKIKKYL